MKSEEMTLFIETAHFVNSVYCTHAKPLLTSCRYKGRETTRVPLNIDRLNKSSHIHGLNFFQ